MRQPAAEAENPRTYSLRTLMLIVTWLAVSCRLASEGSTIGLIGIFLVSLAVLRTISGCKLRPRGFTAMTTAQIMSAFLESVAMVIGATFIGVALFFTIGIAALLLAHSNGPQMAELLWIGAGLLMFMIGPGATFLFLAATWPRNTARR